MSNCRHAARLEAALREGVSATAPPEHGPCAACARLLRRRDVFERGLTGAAEGLAITLPATTLDAARTIRRRPLTFPTLVTISAPALAVVVLAVAVGAGIGEFTKRDRGRSGSPTVDQTVTMYEVPKARRFMLVAGCTTLRGYPSQYAHTDESVRTSHDGFGQSPQAIAAMDACRERFGAQSALTEPEWRAMYAGLREEARCLRGLGYDIAPEPTYDAWRGSPGIWDPLVAFAEQAVLPPTADVITCTDQLVIREGLVGRPGLTNSGQPFWGTSIYERTPEAAAEMAAEEGYEVRWQIEDRGPGGRITFSDMAPPCGDIDGGSVVTDGLIQLVVIRNDPAVPASNC